MFGAVIGYEGLITKVPVSVIRQGKINTFNDMNSEYFHTEELGFSNDGSYFYFISFDRREVEIYIEGIKTAFSIMKEIIN